MIRADSTALKIATATPRAPAWARPGDRAQAGESAALEAAFLAGAGLGALDAFLRLALPWAGVWRRGLALSAAVANIRMIGRREDEAALCDAFAAAAGWLKTLAHPGFKRRARKTAAETSFERKKSTIWRKRFAIAA